MLREITEEAMMRRIEYDEDYLKAEAKFLDLKEAVEGLTALIEGLAKGDAALLKAGRNTDLSAAPTCKIHFGLESNNLIGILIAVKKELSTTEDDIIRYLVKLHFAPEPDQQHRVKIERVDGLGILATLVHEQGFKPKCERLGVKRFEEHIFVLQTEVGFLEQAAA